METILAPQDLLQELAALELPPEREARLALLAAWREQGPLAPDDELEFQAWASLRDQFAYLRDNARRLLGSQVN
jgi:hypothetical protein